MMICVSVMLAVFLGWPLAFGGKGTPTIETSGAAAIAAAAPKPEAAQLPVLTVNLPAQKPAPQAESCYKRYQREVKLCTGANSAACRLQNADHWDMCEATGFWPQ